MKTSKERKLTYKGEPLVRHPAGFFVMPRKVIEREVPAESSGFAVMNLWHATYPEPGYSDAVISRTKDNYWGQFIKTLGVPPCEEFSGMSVVSGYSCKGQSDEYPFGTRKDFGSNVYFPGLRSKDESKALNHGLYFRSEVVTPAQLALENLRLRLDKEAPLPVKMFRIKHLKESASDSFYDFIRSYKDYGCSCHLNPPCCYCTHEGNPANLEEDCTAWVEVLVTESSLHLYSDPFILMEVLYEQRYYSSQD